MEEVTEKNKGGRPKGKTDAIKLRDAAMKDFRVKASKLAGVLLMAQTQEALGSYKIIRKDEIINKKGKVIDIKWAVLDDAEEIEKVLNDFKEMDGAGEIDGKYYMIVKDKPNYRATDSLLNRAWGKPKETHELVGDDGGPIRILLDK